MVDTVPAPATESYGRPIMTQQEHQTQRDLVALSLHICPDGGLRKAKGHEARQSGAALHTR